MPGRRAEPRRTRRPPGVPVLTRLGRAEEGATAVEFAFVAPILLALVIGAVEIANIILVRSTSPPSRATPCAGSPSRR